MGRQRSPRSHRQSPADESADDSHRSTGPVIDSAAASGRSRGLAQPAPPPPPPVGDVTPSVRRAQRKLRATLDGGVAVKQIAGIEQAEVVSGESRTDNAARGQRERGLGAKEQELASKYMRAVPAFTQLSLEALQKVCHKLKVVKFAPGEMIIAKGDVGTAFYMIKSGCVEFTKGVSDGAEDLLGKRNEGEFFGELALIADDNRATANAIAAGKGAECFTLSKRHFDLLLKRSLRDERQKKTGRFRYGEIDFEETGNRVPYLIIPNTDEGRNPASIVEHMVKHMRYKGKTLKKPNIAFNVRAKGQCYLEWVEDVHKNSFLSQKWKWTQLVDAAGTVIQTNQQYYENRRGELMQLRWAGQSEAQLEEAEMRARTEHAIQQEALTLMQADGHDVDTTDTELANPVVDPLNESSESQGQRAILIEKIRDLFRQIEMDLNSGDQNEPKTDTLESPPVVRSDLKDWLLNPSNFPQIDERGLVTRMNIFEEMEVRPDDDLDKTQDLANDSYASLSTSPSQTLSPKRATRQKKRKIYISKTITEDEFVQLCRVDREFLLPFEIQELVPLDEALRHFGDKLLAIFCDVVKGVVNSDGWFLFPAGRRPRHQLIGDTIDKYGGELDDCVMVQYNSLQNPHLLARGDGGSPDEDCIAGHGQPEMDHETFIEKLKDCSKEILPFSKETPEVDERLVYPSEDDLYPNLPDVQGERFQDAREVKLNAIQALFHLRSRNDVERILFSDRWADQDGDHMLQKYELKAVMEHIGYPVSDAEVDEMFELVDTNNDACITKHEFLERFRQDKFEELLQAEHSRMQEDPTSMTDHEPVKITATDWVAKKAAMIGKNDIAIHPNSTHLLFWDLPGTYRGGQCLPWTEIDKFHEYLLDVGVMQGCLVCNGDQTDLNYAMSAVAQSTPVVTMKSVGGASEFLSELFEKRVEGGPDDAGRPQGFAPRYPPDAVEAEYRSNKNTLPKDSDECELIVVDCVNPDVGKFLQKQMADMLTMQDSVEEKMIGFLASERERLQKAWMRSLMYNDNCVGEKRKADLLSYLMIGLQLVVVCLIVYKTMNYGVSDEASNRRLTESYLCERRMLEVVADFQQTAPDSCRAHLMEHSTRRLTESIPLEADATQSAMEQSLGFALIVLPIISGILLTFLNAFQPLHKYHALRWAGFACESEIYTYRARAKVYSASAAAVREWTFDEDENDKAVDVSLLAKAKPSKRFVEKMNNISELVMSEATMQVSSLAFAKEEDAKENLKAKIEALENETHYVATEETVTKADLDTARLGLDNPNRQPTKEQMEFVTKNQNRIGQPVLRQVKDDGFEVLTADEYLAVRAMPALERLRAKLPPLSRRKERLQAMVYATTAVLEYQKLEATIVTLNNSSRSLAHMMLWWDSLSFVERRMAKHKDQLVALTEAAIMSEVNQFYQNTHEDLADDEIQIKSGEERDEP